MFRSLFRPILRTPLTSPLTGRGGGAAWAPLALFASGEQGAWYDPGDFTRYMERGPELVTNGGFADATGWTLGSTWTISGGVAAVNNPGTFSVLVSNAPVVIGKWYEMTFTVVSISAGSIAVRMGAGGFGLTATTAGTYTSRVQCTTSASAYLQATAGTVATIDNVSVRELTAINTATLFQDFTGQVPVTAVEQPVGLILDKRLGLVRGAEVVPDPEMDNPAAWASNSPGVVTVSGGKATFTNAGVGINLRTGDLVTEFGKTYEMVVDVESISSGSLRAFISLGITDSVVLTVGVNRMVVTHKGSTSTPGVYAAIGATSAVVRSISVRELPGNHATKATAAARPKLRLDGANYYSAFDRVDDHLTVAAGGGGTTGICVCAAIRAGGAGNARTIWSDRGTNTGYRLSINASNQLVLSAGNGAAHTEVIGPTVTAGTDYVVTGWHDGTNLNVQLNAGAATSAAFGTATAGTAGFTIGRDNGTASGLYGDRIYEIVYRKDDTSTAGDRTSLITYMAEQAGITL